MEIAIWWPSAPPVCVTRWELFVKNKRILTTGYNGAPAGLDTATSGCARRCPPSAPVTNYAGRCMPAERHHPGGNARYPSGSDALLHPPALHPLRQDDDQRPGAKVVYLHCYPDQIALDFLEQAGIEVVRVEE